MTLTDVLKAYEAITKGKPIPKPGVPELIPSTCCKSLQSLGLDMCPDEDDHEVELRDLDRLRRRRCFGNA